MLGNLRIRAGAAMLLAGVALLIAARGDLLTARDRLNPAAPLLSGGETVVGERIVYPTGAPAKVTAVVLTLAPGQETGWHTHGVPTFGYVIEGELKVDYGEKGIRVYRAGEAMLEAISVPHNGRAVGMGPTRILAVFMGAEGLTTTESVSR